MTWRLPTKPPRAPGVYSMKRRSPRITDFGAKPKPIHKVRWDVVRVFSRTHKQIRSDASIALNLYLWKHGARVLYVRDAKSRLLCPREVDWFGFVRPRVYKGGPLDFSEPEVTVSGPCTNCKSTPPAALRHEVAIHVHFHVSDSKKTRRRP